MSPLEAGTQAPDFSLSDQDGNQVRLADLRGKKIEQAYMDAVRKAKEILEAGETIDHAAAAAAAGLSLLPRTVLVFGNPASGTGPMQHAPTLAIDLPMKMLVWQDDAGQVWVSYNSAGYFADVILARHNLVPPDGQRERLADLLDQVVQDATAFYAE